MHFNKFSVFIDLPSKAEQAYALDLAEKAIRVRNEDESADDLPEVLKDGIENWWFDTEAYDSDTRHGLWLHSIDGGVDAACLFIQHLLQKFNPAGCLTFQWSLDCTSPREGAYGGGAAIITARKVRTIRTRDWVEEEMAKRSASQALGA